MSDIEKEIKKYLSEIKSNLICSGKQKRDIIKEIEDSVYEYAENKGIKDISEVYNHFGTPEEVARTHLSQIEPKKIIKAVNVHRVIIMGVVAILVIFTIALSITLLDAHHDYNSAPEENIVEDTVINGSYILE